MRQIEDIDALVRLTPEQEALAKEMEALYERMQQKNMAFALNENGSVVVYNSEHISDCESAEWGVGCPDGYEFADTDKMRELFQIWTAEDLCVKVKE